MGLDVDTVCDAADSGDWAGVAVRECVAREGEKMSRKHTFDLPRRAPAFGKVICDSCRGEFPCADPVLAKGMDCPKCGARW